MEIKRYELLTCVLLISAKLKLMTRVDPNAGSAARFYRICMADRNLEKPIDSVRVVRSTIK